MTRRFKKISASALCAVLLTLALLSPAANAETTFPADVINASTALPGRREDKGVYDDSAKWLDHLIYSHNVSVCISAGNYYQISEGCMSYNAILVGNINDNHTVDLSDDKRVIVKLGYQESAYSDSNTAAYKPDIMAPGATAGSCYSPMTSSSGGGTKLFRADCHGRRGAALRDVLLLKQSPPF